LKGNQGTMVTHAPISFRMVENDMIIVMT